MSSRGVRSRSPPTAAATSPATGARSIVDPYLFVVTQWAKKTGVDLSGLDNLARFDARMAADPGVQAALKAEGLL